MKLNSIFRFAGRSCSALAMFGMALAAEPLLTNTSNFRIPFAVDGAGANVSGSAVLFVGVNEAPMEQVQTVDASAGGFKFSAPSDGRYAFAVRMTDNSGKLIGNEGSLIPELEVHVDTDVPELLFKLVDAGHGKVDIAWSCSEADVDPGSLRLEYAEGSDGRWKPVSATPAANGRASITVQPGTSIEVRGFVSDLAGNQGTGSAQTVLSQAMHSALAVPGSPSLPLTIPDNSQAVGPSPFNNQTPQLPAYTSSDSLPGPGNTAPPHSAAPQSNTPKGNSQGFVIDTYGQKRSSANSGFGSTPPPTGIPQVQPSGEFGQGYQTPPPQNGFGQQPADSRIGGFSGYGSGSPGYQAPASGSRQIVNSQVFNIDYQVDDVGTSGVSAVELFVTENNGRDWFKYGNDLDLRTPFEVDTRGEGTFGFAVRASNGLGFSQQSPQPGEQPNIVVTVDKTAPIVELGKPQVVVSSGGKIRLSWRVSESNPSDTPVRLEYSANQAGPWIPLFDWQVDRGGHEMPIQPGMPQSLHFRLLTRDVAGNVTASQTNQPVLVDQRRPTARLLRVQPVSRGRSFGL